MCHCTFLRRRQCGAAKALLEVPLSVSLSFAMTINGKANFWGNYNVMLKASASKPVPLQPTVTTDTTTWPG